MLKEKMYHMETLLHEFGKKFLNFGTMKGINFDSTSCFCFNEFHNLVRFNYREDLVLRLFRK